MCSSSHGTNAGSLTQQAGNMVHRASCGHQVHHHTRVYCSCSETDGVVVSDTELYAAAPLVAGCTPRTSQPAAIRPKQVHCGPVSDKAKVVFCVFRWCVYISLDVGCRHTQRGCSVPERTDGIQIHGQAGDTHSRRREDSLKPNDRRDK